MEVSIGYVPYMPADDITPAMVRAAFAALEPAVEGVEGLVITRDEMAAILRAALQARPLPPKEKK